MSDRRSLRLSWLWRLALYCGRLFRLSGWLALRCRWLLRLSWRLFGLSDCRTFRLPGLRRLALRGGRLFRRSGGLSRLADGRSRRLSWLCRLALLRCGRLFRLSRL